MFELVIASTFIAAVTAATFPTVTIPFGALGNVRVTSLSQTLVRFEPEGPNGFEDRTTFTVVDRNSFEGGADLTLTNQTDNEAYLTRTGWDSIYIKYQGNSSKPTPSCKPSRTQSDANDPTRSPTYPNGVKANDSGDCCSKCENDQSCNIWVFATSSEETNTSMKLGDVDGANCWPLMTMSGTKAASNRQVGCKYSQCGDTALTNPFASIVITDIDGAIKYDMSTEATDKPLNVLNWPAPTQKMSYALVDEPRFFVPSWGPTPMPKEILAKNPKLQDTNGYDYSNNVAGDTYVFLFADKTIDSWHASRREFLTLTGPVPLLPDYAFGTWFTYWHQYTQNEAEGEINRWNVDHLPIDVWALDMNWRNTPWACGTCKPCDPSKCPYVDNSNHYYNYPNTDLFPDFANNGTGWFDFLKSQNLRTYFNDHPFPADLGKALQTSADEVNFRWDGLSHWMEKGLTFWWFDANWKFSIPPPQTTYGGSGDGPTWEGMDNRVWGSHVYYDTIKMYNKMNPSRSHTAPAQRPMSLTKYADDNMVPGLVQHQHPAQHRYPVWWTGDGVVLQASVQSMVDSGVYDMKPYVHSDCGGDYRGKVGGDLLRWASHCTFGTILRFHGEQHQPWSYDTDTENYVRNYLNARYKLMPSLITAGYVATQTGFPIVARLDFFYSEHSESTSNEQYLHLNDTLIAPIWDSSNNMTTRNVWIPPGTWEDGWSGERTTGPKSMSVTQPYSRIPMWHKVGGMVVTTDVPGLRVDEQDWSQELVLDVYVMDSNDMKRLNDNGNNKRMKHVYNRLNGEIDQTVIVERIGSSMTTSVVTHQEKSAGKRDWVVRYHLAPNQSIKTMNIDGVSVLDENQVHLSPLEEADGWKYFPFSGKNSQPAPMAGNIVEIRIRSGSEEVNMELKN